MRKTLLLTTLVCLGAATVNAQQTTEQRALRSVARLLTTKAADNATKKVAKHSTTYDYDGMNNTYKYESDYTYNANGTLATELQRNHDTPVTRIQHTYDATVTDFLTLTTEAEYDATTSSWGTEATTYRFDIVRNDAGQITRTVEYDCDEGSEPSVASTVDIAYGTDGLPSEMTIAMDNDLTGEVEITLTDLTWSEASSQQMAEIGTIFSLLSGGRQLTSATMGFALMGLPLSGPLSVAYEDNGNITASVDLGFYGTTYMTFKIEQTITDAYGSYTLDVISGGMGDNSCSRTATTYDAQGNTLLYEEFEGTSTSDLEKSYGEKYTYDYNGDGTTVNTVVSYSWNEDDDTYSEYEKTVYDEYTTDISTPTEALSGAFERVFLLDGQILSQPVENLPSGLYIVQKGSRTIKIVKH